MIIKKQTIKQIGQKWLLAFPTILVSFTLFLTIWNFFGVSNVIMPPFLTLIFKIKHTQDFHLKELIKMYAIMILVAILSFVATLTVPLAILLNVIVPFLLVYILTNKFNPKSYFIYGMEFVMLQLMPIKLSAMPTRFLALLYSFTIITIALYVHAFVVKRKRHYGTIRKAVKNISLQLKKIANNESCKKENDELSFMMFHMNQVVYSSRNYSYLVNGYGKVNYLFMMAFQRFHYFVDHFSGEKWSEQEKLFLLKLSDIFNLMEKEVNTKDNTISIKMIQQLRQNCKFKNTSVQEALNEILVLINYSLEQMQNVSMYQSQKEWKIQKDSKQAKSLKEFLKLDIFQIRFALRLSVVLGISFAFCRISGLNHSYWYPMTSFFMLMPSAEESNMKIKNRIIGTMAGVFLSFILMSGLKTPIEHIVIIFLATCFMYYVPVTSWTMPMYTTCYAMVLATMNLKLEDALIMRIIYVSMAAITTFLANHYLLPNTAKSEFKNSINELFDIDVDMIKLMRKSNKNTDKKEFINMTVHSRLLTNDILMYVKKNMKKEKQDFYIQMININQKLVSEIVQLSSYLCNEKININVSDNSMLEELFTNFEKMIYSIRQGFLSDELTGFTKVDIKNYNLDNLTDMMYFNTLAINCAESLESLANLKTNKITI